MKKAFVFVASLMVFSASAETLDEAGYMGSWSLVESQQGFGRLEIYISNKFEIEVLRDFPKGGISRCKVEPQDFQFSEGLLFFKCPLNEKVEQKFILGGWVLSSGAKSIFGTLYLFNKNGLFNGISIRLDPANITSE